MRVIGFSFEKINAERLNERTESLKYNTKINISNIETLKSDLIRTKDEILKISFNYGVAYEPNYAKVELVGNLLLAVEPRAARDILREWQEKKTSEDFRLLILNVIIRKASIKALELEEDLGLPPHVPLPNLKKQEQAAEENKQ